MHADLMMLLYLLYLSLDYDFQNSQAKLPSISLPSSCRGHPGLATCKYRTV